MEIQPGHQVQSHRACAWLQRRDLKVHSAYGRLPGGEFGHYSFHSCLCAKGFSGSGTADHSLGILNTPCSHAKTSEIVGTMIRTICTSTCNNMNNRRMARKTPLESAKKIAMIRSSVTAGIVTASSSRPDNLGIFRTTPAISNDGKSHNSSKLAEEAALLKML